MEIKKITLKNIRCFQNLEIDLSSKQGFKKWMVVLGDNGSGKSTVLRSIALGLSEESGAAALLAEISDLVRNGEEQGTIRIDVLPHEGYIGEAYVETTIKRSEYDEFKLTQVTIPKEPKTFKWEKLFLCAYGASRGIIGSADVSEYAVTDSVYSLFNYKSDLQNPELALRRIQGEIDVVDILRKLEKILMVNENAVELTRNGITVSGPWGKSMPFRNLSDGYKSTITWLLDLYGWKLLSVEHLTNSEVEGIIIVDELEQHLHPRWQKEIIKLLAQQFPKVQFIVTTHSPLCVVGTTDLTDEDCGIIVLHQNDDSVIAKKASPPRGKRADQVLTSYLFELYTSGDDEIKRSIEKYNNLFNINRNDSQEVEFNRLYKYLNETLGSAETELEKKVGKVLNDKLNELFKEKINEQNTKKSPENLELIRQLNELL